MKKLVLGFSLTLSAAAGLAGEAGCETLVYLPFDSDLESKVYADRNGKPYVYTSDGGSVSYPAPSCSFVCDGGYGIPGRTANAGYLALDRARVYVPLENFALSNDLEVVTIEFFVRAGESDMNAWDEWLWLASIDGTPVESTWADRGSSMVYSQVSGSIGKADLEVWQKWTQGGNMLLNGKWHHVAIVIQPNDGGGSTVTYTIDYGTDRSYSRTDKWMGNAGALSNKQLWLAIGGRNAAGKMDIDELRITKGALPAEKFLHLVSNLPKSDCDAYVYMPLDGDFDSLACRDVVTHEVSGAIPTFVTSVLDRRICESGDWDAQPRLGGNEGCQFANKQQSSVKITNPWLCNGDAQPLTIEFFMKGSDGADEVSAWSEQFRLVGSSGFDLLMQGNGDKMYYFRFDGQDSGDNAIAFTPGISENDGHWHHFAFTLEPGDSGAGTKITAYADYCQFGQMTTRGPWVGYRTGVKTLSFGAQNDVFWCDEFRISKGVLPVSKFLRQSAVEKPEDGDAILYLPLDKDLLDVACPGDNLANKPDGAAFTIAEPWKKRVVEYGGRDTVVRSENLGCLLRSKRVCDVMLASEWLTNGLDTATIEFFMKGSAVEGEMTTWGEELKISGQKGGRYALLVQADGDKKYYFRFDDVDSKSIAIVPGIRVDDGRWHHFAFTIAPNATGGTDIKGYVDYGSAISQTLPGRWLGIGSGDHMSFGTQKDVFWYDEVRISKGVLPKEKFLRQRADGGSVVIVR